jgi:hypothetical protein
VLREARSAVLETDAESQALVRVAARHLLGRDVGNIFQFKSFPLALVMDQARRIAEINARKGRRRAATYVASFVAGMTMLGAVAAIEGDRQGQGHARWTRTSGSTPSSRAAARA